MPRVGGGWWWWWEGRIKDATLNLSPDNVSIQRRGFDGMTAKRAFKLENSIRLCVSHLDNLLPMISAAK